MNYNRLLTGEELAQKMSAQLKTTKNVRIVSAYLTSPAVHWLSEHLAHPNIKILGRFRPRDFLSGASDIRAVEVALKSGYEVYMLENLHAKIYELDQKAIFAGSANFTSKGLSLCSTPNTEVAVELPCTVENQLYIDKLFRGASKLSADHFELMKRKLDDNLIADDEQNIDEWGISFANECDELFLSDLPLCPPFEICEQYKISPQLDFAEVSSKLENISLATELFKKTKCYRWLYTLITYDYIDGIRFGELSKRLHDAIKDDPSPYRKKVKEIQVNILLFLELLASDTFELYKPGPRSQVLKLK